MDFNTIFVFVLLLFYQYNDHEMFESFPPPNCFKYFSIFFFGRCAVQFSSTVGVEWSMTTFWRFFISYESHYTYSHYTEGWPTWIKTNSPQSWILCKNSSSHSLKNSHFRKCTGINLATDSRSPWYSFTTL